MWAAIHLRLSFMEVGPRLSARGRVDDTPDAISSHWMFYRREVVPTLGHLSSRLGAHRVIELDAHVSYQVAGNTFVF